MALVATTQSPTAPRMASDRVVDVDPDAGAWLLITAPLARVTLSAIRRRGGDIYQCLECVGQFLLTGKAVRIFSPVHKCEMPVFLISRVVDVNVDARTVEIAVYVDSLIATHVNKYIPTRIAVVFAGGIVVYTPPLYIRERDAVSDAHPDRAVGQLVEMMDALPLGGAKAALSGRGSGDGLAKRQTPTPEHEAAVCAALHTAGDL